MPHLPPRRLPFLMAASVLVWSASLHAQEEVALPLPPSIEVGQCRPINIASAEMDRQWKLYYGFTGRMRASAALRGIEEKSLAAQGMRAERVECFQGDQIFAGLCFSTAKTKSLDVKTIKLMHSPTGADCLAITTVVRR